MIITIQGLCKCGGDPVEVERSASGGELIIVAKCQTCGSIMQDVYHYEYIRRDYSDKKIS
jgi:hypothetical protein